MTANADLPSELVAVREAALRALQDVEPSGPPHSDAEGRGLILSARTNGGRNLPPYYLVYFLLIDLLGFPSLGQWEKSAWTVPVRYRGRLYGIEHRKLGLGVFAPNLDAEAKSSGKPSDLAEEDAAVITALITKAASIAEPYFKWRAEQAASTANVNVVNKSVELFDRYKYFRNQSQVLFDRTEEEVQANIFIAGARSSRLTLRRAAEWNAQAAIEAFFSWTEHVFIHLAILQGVLRSGAEVARLAESDWKAKFRAALDISDAATKAHYDVLLDLRGQVRNFMAHGAFGKRGEAFHFHSNAGAVPVLLTDDRRHKFSLVGRAAFDEGSAIAEIDSFVQHLWSGSRAAARPYIFSSLPTILSHVSDGTYARAMRSEDEMSSFVEYLSDSAARAADMDW